MEKTLKAITETNKGHNMMCDIKEAFVEVVKYHIRRNEGTNFKFNTTSCAEADENLIKSIAKLIAKAEGIGASTKYIGCGINDIQYGVNLDDNTLGYCSRSNMSMNSIKISSEFKRSYEVYTTLLHEIVHWTQNKMNNYEFDSYDIEYRKRKHEVQAFFISEYIINMLKK